MRQTLQAPGPFRHEELRRPKHGADGERSASADLPILPWNGDGVDVRKTNSGCLKAESNCMDW